LVSGSLAVFGKKGDVGDAGHLNTLQYGIHGAVAGMDVGLDVNLPRGASAEARKKFRGESFWRRLAGK